MAASSEKLKQVNKQSIKDYFYEVKFSNKNQLAQATGISKTTCTTLIKELMEEGFLKQTENNESTGGRPSKGYELNKDFYHVCLIMIQNGQLPKIQFEIKNLWGESIEKYEEEVKGSCIEHLQKNLSKLISEVAKISYIALSIPGVINAKDDILSCDIWEFENKNMHDILDQYEIPFIIENDVNLAVVGYHTIEESVVFLYQPGSMYSGCGIMLDHQLYRGSTLFAGEVGYLNGCAFVEPEDFDVAQMTIIEQLTALICVLNPQKIVIQSSYDLEKQKLINALEANIQKIHIPEIEMTSDIELYISKGLMEAAVDLERDHMKVKEIKKL